MFSCANKDPVNTCIPVFAGQIMQNLSFSRWDQPVYTLFDGQKMMLSV
jgi:hypothetical protein